MVNKAQAKAQAMLYRVLPRFCDVYALRGDERRRSERSGPRRVPGALAGGLEFEVQSSEIGGAFPFGIGKTPPLI